MRLINFNQKTKYENIGSKKKFAKEITKIIESLKSNISSDDIYNNNFEVDDKNVLLVFIIM